MRHFKRWFLTKKEEIIYKQIPKNPYDAVIERKHFKRYAPETEEGKKYVDSFKVIFQYIKKKLMKEM